MPYTTDTLPPEVDALPKGARDIWLAAFNSAFKAYAGDSSAKEQIAFRVAWAAVGKKYHKNDAGKWVANDGGKAVASDASSESVHWDVPLVRGRQLKSVVGTAAEATERVSFAPILVPWQMDTQGDIVTPEEIQKAAYLFADNPLVGIQHAQWGNIGKFVEYGIARQGDPDFAEGTWFGGIKWSEAAWQHVLNDEITGLSIGGGWKRVPIADDVPASLAWLEGIVVKEVSGVNLAANRGQFVGFKSADGGEGDAMSGLDHRREAKSTPAARGTKDAPADGTSPPADGASPPDAAAAPAIPGVTLLPWMDAKQIFTDAFCTDDAPRLAGLLIAKYGEGPNGEIKLPEGADPVAEANTAIGEAKNLMKDNPLLRPDGNPAATVTKSVLVKELDRLLSAFGVKRAGKKDVAGEAATAVLDAPTADPAVLAELKALNGHLAKLEETPPPAKEGEGGEPAEGETAEPVPGDASEAATEGEIGAKSNADLHRLIGSLIKKVEGLEKELAEARAGKKTVPSSKAVHDPGRTVNDGAKPATFPSSMLGADMPYEKVERFLSERTKAAIAR